MFSAIKANEFIVDPITLPSRAENLDTCLGALETGFRQIFDSLKEPPVAISFAFPGPADYPNGIIGGYLPNFPSFRDGVALKAFLEDKFGVPVYINNDADLYAYGEALAGALPEINDRLAMAGSPKRYRNLLGYTLGTGFGFGFVSNGKLHIGDNSCVETFCLRNKKYPDIMLEEGVAIRAVKRVYGELSGNKDHGFEPKDICEIAEGLRPGDQQAAIASFAELGEIAGDAIATAVSLIDGIVVIGGGLSGAKKFIMPSLLREMRSKLMTFGGERVARVQSKVYNLDDDKEFAEFAKSHATELKVYGSYKTVPYDPEKRIGVIISRIGASKAISLGAYAYALAQIDAE